MSQPEKIDDVTKVAQDSILPAAKQQPGFKGWLVVTDRDSGKAYSITLWETEDDMLAGEKSGYLQEQVAKLGAFLTAPPTTEHLEVILQA
jgi:heme-degrading monooxygenase HmoA